jgi:hypothetical protein
LIDGFLLGLLPFAGSAPLGALLTLAVGFHLIAYHMIAPPGRYSTPPTRSPTFIGGDGPLGIGLTGKWACLNLGDMGGEGLGLFELLIRMGLGMALG